MVVSPFVPVLLWKKIFQEILTLEKKIESSQRPLRGFPGASAVKKPPAMQKTWVRSLGREDSLEKEMATHSGILAWRISWTEETGGL